MDTDIPGSGHNQPPEPMPAERWAELVDNANVWAKNVATIKSAEQAGRCQAFVDQLRLETEAVEGAWNKEREPYDLALVVLRAKYRPPLELLGIALDKMKALAKDWLDREKARLAHEAAERKRLAAEAEAEALRLRQEAARGGATVQAEAAARQAEQEAEAARALALKPVERPAIKGEFSAKAMSMRTYWSAVITDEKLALKHFAKHPAIRSAALEAIVKLETAHAKKVKDAAQAPPGVRFEKEERPV
jgi:regulator of protease activity HflC (stomatin/prohibitin superfamily)